MVPVASLMPPGSDHPPLLKPLSQGAGKKHRLYMYCMVQLGRVWAIVSGCRLSLRKEATAVKCLDGHIHRDVWSVMEEEEEHNSEYHNQLRFYSNFRNKNGLQGKKQTKGRQHIRSNSQVKSIEDTEWNKIKWQHDKQNTKILEFRLTLTKASQMLLSNISICKATSSKTCQM